MALSETANYFAKQASEFHVSIRLGTTAKEYDLTGTSSNRDVRIAFIRGPGKHSF